MEGGGGRGALGGAGAEGEGGLVGGVGGTRKQLSGLVEVLLVALELRCLEWVSEGWYGSSSASTAVTAPSSSGKGSGGSAAAAGLCEAEVMLGRLLACAVRWSGRLLSLVMEGVMV